MSSNTTHCLYDESPQLLCYLQQIRLRQLYECMEFIALGQLPPKNYPCFNGDCPRTIELIEYASEVELCEFVISGLCGSCQNAAFDFLHEYAGEDSHPVGVPDPEKVRAEV